MLDVGAGTGKFTRLLMRTSATVIATEPVAQMRQQLATALPGVTTLAAPAQALPLSSASVDAVVCAQSFHWFANPASLAEFHRVLRPGGRLGLVWNVRDENVEWVHEITRLIAPYEGDTPRYHTGAWRRALAEGPFSAPQLSVYPYVHVGNPETVIVERFASVSFIAAMSDADKNRLLDQLRRRSRITRCCAVAVWSNSRIRPTPTAAEARAVVGAAFGPAGPGLCGGLDRVSQVLARALGDVGEERAALDRSP